MHASYKQLITEHEAIEAAANGLLAEIDSARTTSAQLAQQLDNRAVAVEEHVAVEAGVVSAFEKTHLTGPWIEAWQEGLGAFECLKADWTRFLGAWDEANICDDRAGFGADAHVIFGRLKDRVQLETSAFYATALQTGAITLR